MAFKEDILQHMIAVETMPPGAMLITPPIEYESVLSFKHDLEAGIITITEVAKLVNIKPRSTYLITGIRETV